MPCFFCYSNNHVSHNCSIHKTDEQRRKILRLKSCCQSCLAVSKIQCNVSMCLKCLVFQKCYICFSKAHHTVFCPDRFTLPNLFVPNIDNDLLSRLIKMFSTPEKHSLFLSLPVITNFVKLEPFKIKCITRNYTRNPINCDEYDFVVAEQACFGNNSDGINRTNGIFLFSFSFPPLKDIVFHIQHLVISGTKFFSNKLLQLLSSKTLILNCKSTEFQSKLAIAEILKKAPNLEFIDLHLTNVKIYNSWPVDLLQYNNAKKLKQLTISIHDLNFNVKSLATLMKKKPANIDLHVSRNGHFDVKKVANKLSTHFTTNSFKFQSYSVLNIIITDSFGTTSTKQYVLKTF